MGEVVQLITLSTPTRVEVELGWGCGWAVTIIHTSWLWNPSNQGDSVHNRGFCYSEQVCCKNVEELSKEKDSVVQIEENVKIKQELKEKFKIVEIEEDEKSATLSTEIKSSGKALIS